MSEIKVEHNSVPWRVATNRHTNTDGSAWGWIEGAPGNVCWSNGHGSYLTSTDASRIVADHNQWLERQTPVGVRLLKARERAAVIAMDLANAESQAQRLRTLWSNAQTLISELVTEQEQALADLESTDQQQELTA